MTTSKKRERTTIEMPDVAEGCSVYDFIIAAGMERRMLDIALAQGECPSSLKFDAEQDIRFEWINRPADLSMKPSQVLAYASLMARHTVLRVRRELGSPARLPGSAFRKRPDGSTYVGIGALAPSLSVDDVQGWFEFTDGHLDPDYARDYLSERDGNPEELHDAWSASDVELETDHGQGQEETAEMKTVTKLFDAGKSAQEISDTRNLPLEVVELLLQKLAVKRKTEVITKAYAEVRAGSLTMEQAAEKYNVPLGWLSHELKMLAEGIALETMMQSVEHGVVRKRRELLNKTKELIKNEDVLHAIELLTNGVKLVTIYKTLNIAVKDRPAFHKEVLETAKRMRKAGGIQKSRKPGEDSDDNIDLDIQLDIE